MRAARWATVVLGTVTACVSTSLVLDGAVRAAPPIEDVMLTDIGDGFVLVDETVQQDQLLRTFQGEHADLLLSGMMVTDPPGVRTAFEGFSKLSKQSGLDSVEEPSLDLAAWVLTHGEALGGDGIWMLTFASRDAVFTTIIGNRDASAGDPKAFLLDLAERQIAAAGGPPAVAEQETPERGVAENAVTVWLPSDVPRELGLVELTTMSGNDELSVTDDVNVEVATFLNDNSTTATRVWSQGAGQLFAAVNVTQYPYDIFAAASVNATTADGKQVVSTNALADVADVVAFRGVGDAANVFGTAFRRGDAFVLVWTQRTDDVSERDAAALAAALTRLTAERLPAEGGTAGYAFPDARSKLLGLALTAAIVTAAAAGSAVIARLRARRVRRHWSGGELPPPDASGGRPGVAIALDHDADRLRRRGGIIAVGQLLAVIIGVVALAGDFAWAGVIVAAIALVAGLVLTHWWQRRELSLLGAKAPPREFVLPRPAGAIVGVLALAVLGFGVAYLLKGLRYLVLRPTLAQMKWSNWLDVAPRTVGVIFTIGGFMTAVIGAWLFRLARALGRAGTKRTLQVDTRPAALYLRSFEDDDLPLPAIASARRPLFELFSLRGADPFEESVAWELNSYGPVVAVGRPGKSLASLGAAREHLADDAWRDQVAARMDEAGIIAVATGETDGLAWELGQVVSGGHLAKTFFVFPPVTPEELGRRWERTAAWLVHAGQAVGPLPVPPSRVHTVRLDPNGACTVTYADRRDEATYRTAVDRTLAPA